MIPQFPQFKKLEITDKREIENHNKLFPPYSDFNFASLWSYDTDQKIEISWLLGNLVIRFQDYITDELFYSFLGNSSIIETSNILLQHAAENGLTPILKLIPEHSLKNIRSLQNHFIITEDRANFDYIHSIEELVNLKGKKFHYKRRHLKNFHKYNQDIRIEKLNFNENLIKSHILTVFLDWEKAKNKKREETKRELEAIERLIDKGHEFALITIGIYQQDRLVGFAIGETVHDNYSVFHFLKANPLYKGVFTALYNLLASELHTKGIQYINCEQDLGIETLMQAKQEWRPTGFLKKYIIAKK